MTALGAALEALEAIAARGIVVRTKDGVIVFEDGTRGPAFRCPECGEDQVGQGPCGNHDCLTNIARRGIDEARRAL